MKKRYIGPQIVAKLRQADVLIGQGKTVPEVCKYLEISQQTYYRWRQKYGGMSPDMVKQLRAVQKENAQLHKLVADQALDISILKVLAGHSNMETTRKYYLSVQKSDLETARKVQSQVMTKLTNY